MTVVASEARRYYERYWTGATATRGGFAWLDAGSDDASGVSARPLLEFFRPVLRGHVLDAGCGAGRLLRHIVALPNVARAIGMDLAIGALERTRLGGRSPLVHGGVEALPFAAAAFDCIVAAEVVEHVLDVDAMAGEFARCLKAGGHLCVTTTDFNVLKRVAISLFTWDDYFYPTSPHVRFFTKKTLAKVLSRHGLALRAHGWNGSYWGLMPFGQMAVFEKREI